ncbi:TRAP transporter small permease [Vannielia litorea]|uniref:TRAP transporter small permease protein n=1 Tax=Vannielia litorea TaxID=1217970 RepID=A0A1N6GGY2_9RHOB|nr:TRAP transporter small permease subunit [Vannielia litorea]SIO06764.1 TRAP-type C4-dicarboxylate transport system, small permease component [Vannielia litorea]
MLRKTVTLLSNACGVLAAVFLAGIAVATLLQIVARQLGRAVETTELSGFFLAASTFLGLAYTLIHGGHVRVSLVSQFVAPGVRRAVELWCCAVAIGITGYMAWQVTRFTHETFSFGDLSPGMLAVPLWIPQSAVAFGLVVLFLALVEQAVIVLSGEKPDYLTNADSVGE